LFSRKGLHAAAARSGACGYRRHQRLGLPVVPVAVPPLLSLRGLVVYAQGVVLDTVGPLFGIAALTGGVTVRIGD
jgi:hypothetical protein